ncbi:flagellar hook-length control protein FliK [Chitinivorax sp. PXF-14]|uniref:flagellar hook-length control protein FliK n=1 Tax=Chitinivorax sp. PXF-14 TaxID=3230488 RepID=UPI003466E747
MIHNDGLSQLNLLVKRYTPTVVESAQDKPADGETSRFSPGERLPAFVMASLPNGRFEVLIKNQVLDMNLPANTQAGETLDLTFIQGDPRPTFALTKDLATLLGNAQPEVKFSDTAKFLGSLINSVAEKGGSPAAVSSQPLIDAAAPDTGKLADSLHEELAKSGFFYESHQAEWVTGQRTLQALQAEPQARQEAPPSTASTTAQVAGADKASSTAEPARAAAGATESAQTGSVRSATLLLPDAVHAQKEPAPGLNAADLAPQLRHIVQQQLDILDTRQVLWQGQAWPNQPMEWLVEEQPTQPGEGGNADGERVWYSRLKLSMPHLGDVVVGVSLHGQSVSVNFQVARQGTAEQIRSHVGKLDTQLQAAGLKLSGSVVDTAGS